MLVPGLLVVSAVFCPHPFLHLSLECFLQRGRVLDAHGILECLIGSSLLLFVFLLLDFFSGHLFRPYESLVLPTGKAPHGQCRNDNGQQQVFGAEEPFAVHEEGIEEYLDAIVERDTGCKEEQQYGLEDVQRAPFLHTFAREVEGTDQQHHGGPEMVRYGEACHHIAEREQQG